MARSEGRMNQSNEIMVSNWWNIKMRFKVKMSTIEMPIRNGGTRKQRRVLGQIVDSIKNQRVRGRRKGNFINKSGVNNVNEKVIRQKGNVCIVRGSIRVSKAGQGISRPHSGSWSVNKGEIKIL